MAETSRKKKLPIAVLAVPALAFGSFTLSAVPAVAVEAQEVLDVLEQEGVDSVLLRATTDIEPEVEVEGAEVILAEDEIEVTSESIQGETVSWNGAIYPLEQFVLVQAEQDETEEPQITVGDTDIVPGGQVAITLTGFAAGDVDITLGEENLGTFTVNEEGTATGSVDVPTDLAEGNHQLVATHTTEADESATYRFTYEEAPETEAPDTLRPELSVSPEAQVGDAIQLTVENYDDLVAEYGPDYEWSFESGITSGPNHHPFDSDGIIQPVSGISNQFEYTIPTTIDTVDGPVTVGEGDRLDFSFTFQVQDADLGPVSRSSDSVRVAIIAGDTQVEEETPEPEADLAEPGLNVEPTEILLDNFIGDPEDDETGVLHTVVGAAADSTVEYSVDTPDTIAEFEESDLANEDGVLEFWIHGYETTDPSVYLGEYTTTVTFEDAQGEPQEFSASFTVVDGSGDDDVTPVVDIEDPADEEDDAPALGSADDLAETGASGPQLAWIAAGLLALGGGLVLFANRARLFERKN